LWNALPNYPAVWLWYGYGLGAVKAGRYDVLYGWLTQPLEKESDVGSVPAVKRLFLWDWPGAREGPWSSLEGAVQSRDVLSDYLRFRFRSMIGREFVSDAEFDRVFERFELLASITHVGVSTDKAELQQMLTDPRDLSRTPMGRLSSGIIGAPPVLTELRREDVSARLLTAGFAKSDPEFLDVTLNSLQRGLNWRFR
jgi:hypothetical protein